MCIRNEEDMIHPTATVEENVKIGNNSKIWHYAHIREYAEIGADCVIGKDVYIDHHVKIGNGCKIENGVSIYYGVELEDYVFVGPHTVFTNDKYPRAFPHKWDIVKTFIRSGVGIGAGSVIVCGIEIGKYALIGAGSVVTQNIQDYALFMGSPAKFEAWICKCGRNRTNLPGELCSDCNRLYK
jgi:acetyltransferase-like isoleucine patch superfamily enzyme